MKRNQEEQAKIYRALCDVVIEASEAELRADLSDADEDFESLAARGRAVAKRALESSREEKVGVEDLRRGLGALIQMLRQKKGISVKDLAVGARVDATELQRIEFDPSFDANPRTIYQLAEYFNLPPRSLVVLSGAVQVEGSMRQEAVRFAACAKNMGKLSREEKRLLNSFVKFLREYTER